MCDHCGKVLFRSRKLARQARKRMRPSAGLSAYRCPVRAGFHLGHLPPGGRDSARRMRIWKAAS